MHTEMYLSLNVNGTLHQGRHGEAVPPAVLADFAGRAARSGALVVGRTTFDRIQAAGAMAQLSTLGTSLFVLTTRPLDIEEVTETTTPEHAVRQAQDAGHNNLLIAGGAKTYEAFFRSGLVDRITLNILPVLTNEDLRVEMDVRNELTLSESDQLDDGIVQLSYEMA